MFFQKSNEIKQLKAQIEQLNAMLSPEQQNVVALQNQLVALTHKEDHFYDDVKSIEMIEGEVV